MNLTHPIELCCGIFPYRDRYVVGLCEVCMWISLKLNDHESLYYSVCLCLTSKKSPWLQSARSWNTGKLNSTVRRFVCYNFLWSTSINCITFTVYNHVRPCCKTSILFKRVLDLRIFNALMYLLFFLIYTQSWSQAPIQKIGLTFWKITLIHFISKAKNEKLYYTDTTFVPLAQLSIKAGNKRNS